MKILILGSGAVASVVLKYLADDPGVSEVVCGSKDVGYARQFLKAGDPKIRFLDLDASAVPSIIAAGRGVDVIINASLPRFNENAMEVALEVGAHYQDLASELTDFKTAEQLKFDERFKKAKKIALINTGIAPGISNLLAREAADDLEAVDSIRFRCVEDQMLCGFAFSWSMETTIDELTAPPLVYRDGRFGFSKPFEDAEEYDFAGSFGRRRVYSIYGDEVATIPLFIKAKNVDFKSSGTDMEFSKALADLGLFSKEPIIIDGTKVVPLDVFKKLAPAVPSPDKMRQLVKDGILKDAAFGLSVEATGKRDGKNVTIKMDASFPRLLEIYKDFPGATYISYPTGTAVYAFLKSMPMIRSFGVMPPEALDRDVRAHIIKGLSERNIVVSRRPEK